MDSGWPHCLPTLKNQVKTSGLKITDIRYVMMTHAHPDHAGLTQTVKRLCGAQLVVKSSNRAALQSIGILGELVKTPCHSLDSLSHQRY